MVGMKWYQLHRNPCNRCLVITICRKQYDCAVYEKFHRRLNRMKNLAEVFNSVVIVSGILAGCLFLIVTFLFGFWKWYDILRPIAVNLFNYWG